MKSYFLQRLISYLVDFFIVAILVSLLTFFIPVSNEYDNAIDRANEAVTSYTAGDISSEEYIDIYGETNYVVAKETMIITVINLVVTVAYFGTYAYYKNGQTIGKKLMHIKIDGKDGKTPSHKVFLLRTLLINGVITGSISLLLLLFIKSNMYFYTVFVSDLIQTIFIFTSAFMIMFRQDGRGLHDIICGTKVVFLK